MDMELAVPRNLAENSHLIQLMNERKLDQPVWLGVSDIFNHGRFVNLQGIFHKEKFLLLQITIEYDILS